MAYILGIGGSPRAGGNSDRLLKWMLAGAEAAGGRAEAVFLREYSFESCIGCERCRKDKACTGLKDGMQLIYPMIEEATGLILASPVHHYNVSALLKAFIDRLYQYYDFSDDRPRGYSSRLANQGRKALVTAVCEQVEPKDMGYTLEMMELPLEALGYEVLNRLPVYGIFDKGAVKDNEEIQERARALGKDLVEKCAAAGGTITV